MNKAEAAKALDVSVRTLENYISRIQKREETANVPADERFTIRYLTGRNRGAADLSDENLERIRDEMNGVNIPTPKTTSAPMVETISIPATQEPTPTDEPQNQLARIEPAHLAPTTGNVYVVSQEGMQTLLSEVHKSSQRPAISELAQLPLLSIEQSAAFLNVGVGTIKRAIKDGQLSVKTGLARGHRLKRSDLEAWAEAQ